MNGAEWIPMSQLADYLVRGFELLEDKPVRVDGVVYVRVYLPGQRVYS